MIASRSARGVRLHSRHGKDLTRFFPDVAEAIAESIPAGTVIDGELVVWDTATGTTSFGLLGKRVTAGRGIRAEAAAHPAHIVCFDLLHFRGQSIMDRPLRQRRQRLEQLLHHAPAQVVLCPQSSDVAQAEEWMRDWTAAGVEGVVIKPADGRYEPGRGGWFKLRARHTTEAIIAGVTGSLESPDCLLLGRLDDGGRLRYTGRTLPLTNSQRRDVAAMLTAAVEHPWPLPLPVVWQGRLGKPNPLRYLQTVPALVAEVAADAAYEGGRFRHQPRFARLRPDLEPRDIPQWTISSPAAGT